MDGFYLITRRHPQSGNTSLNKVAPDDQYFSALWQGPGIGKTVLKAKGIVGGTPMVLVNASTMGFINSSEQVIGINDIPIFVLYQWIDDRPSFSMHLAVGGVGTKMAGAFLTGENSTTVMANACVVFF